jgi:hypothetical protein
MAALSFAVRRRRLDRFRQDLGLGPCGRHKVGKCGAHPATISANCKASRLHPVGDWKARGAALCGGPAFSILCKMIYPASEASIQFVKTSVSSSQSVSLWLERVSDRCMLRMADALRQPSGQGPDPARDHQKPTASVGVFLLLISSQSHQRLFSQSSHLDPTIAHDLLRITWVDSAADEL